MSCPHCHSDEVIEHDVTMVPIIPIYHCVCQRCGFEWQHR